MSQQPPNISGGEEGVSVPQTGQNSVSAGGPLYHSASRDSGRTSKRAQGSLSGKTASTTSERERRGLRSLAAKLGKLVGEGRHRQTGVPAGVTDKESHASESPELPTATVRPLPPHVIERFDADEVALLVKIFKELKMRNPQGTGTIDKETFLQYFSLPSVWGERLFTLFGYRKSGGVDFEELMQGLSICCRGTKAEKVKVLFDIFDLDGNGQVSRDELALILSNVPHVEEYLQQPPPRGVTAVNLSRSNSKTTLVQPQNAPKAVQPVSSSPARGGAAKPANTAPDATGRNQDGSSSSNAMVEQDDDNESSDSSSRSSAIRQLYSTWQTGGLRAEHSHPPAVPRFCSAISWQTSVSGVESSRQSPRRGSKDGLDSVPNSHGSHPAGGATGALDDTATGDYLNYLEEEDRPIIGAGPSPMVAELLAEAQKQAALASNPQHMGSAEALDVETLTASIIENYDLTESGGLSPDEFRNWIEHHPKFLQLFSDCLREEVWGLHGHGLYRPHKNPLPLLHMARDLPHDLPPSSRTQGNGGSNGPPSALQMVQLEKWIKIQQLFNQAAPKQQSLTGHPQTIPSFSSNPTGIPGPSVKQDPPHGSHSNENNGTTPASQAATGQPAAETSGAPYIKHSRYAGSREVLDFLEISLGHFQPHDLTMGVAPSILSVSPAPPALTSDSTAHRNGPSGNQSIAVPQSCSHAVPSEGGSVSLHPNHTSHHSHPSINQQLWQEKKEALSCPNCHSPLIVCPECDARFPVLTFGDGDQQVTVECPRCVDDNAKQFTSCWICHWPFSKAVELIDKHEVMIEGELWKVGQHSGQWVHRYYVLVDRILYYYTRREDKVPRGFVFLEGCFVDPITAPGDSHGGRQKYGFCIIHGGNFGRRDFFAADEVTRDKWVATLRIALNQQPIDQLFDLHEVIGQGKFSVVYRATEKRSGQGYAVKVINKLRMTFHEKELLRSEMAILRVLRHNHVIFLKSIVASRETLHIIMELVTGGELFDAIAACQGRGMKELTVHRITAQLLKTLLYLHKSGIVHRDLKPENILLTSKNIDEADVKVADFGLSCICGPTEQLVQPCGTLAYVAPEVLTLQGYSHPVDLWSLGIIVYLLLAGRLPFPVLRKSGLAVLTDREKYYVLKFEGAAWKGVSRSAQDFISRLLAVDPDERMTASEALQHIWIKNPCAVLKGTSPQDTSSDMLPASNVAAPPPSMGAPPPSMGAPPPSMGAPPPSMGEPPTSGFTAPVTSDDLPDLATTALVSMVSPPESKPTATASTTSRNCAPLPPRPPKKTPQPHITMDHQTTTQVPQAATSSGGSNVGTPLDNTPSVSRREAAGSTRRFGVDPSGSGSTSLSNSASRKSLSLDGQAGVLSYTAAGGNAPMDSVSSQHGASSNANGAGYYADQNGGAVIAPGAGPTDPGSLLGHGLCATTNCSGDDLGFVSSADIPVPMALTLAVQKQQQAERNSKLAAAAAAAANATAATAAEANGGESSTERVLSRSGSK